MLRSVLVLAIIFSVCASLQSYGASAPSVPPRGTVGLGGPGGGGGEGPGSPCDRESGDIAIGAKAV
jgi:hypothetical protein